jgi:hypothetical protein
MMHFSMWLYVGTVLTLPWLVTMVRLRDSNAGNVDPMDKRSILFWSFLLGIILLAVGIGISVSGR